jgi:Prenyltransferase and squalene oxidase repeat
LQWALVFVRSIESILNLQNRDGGWPYARGVSWTEPTVFAIMAASAAGHRDAADRGFDWLRRNQRADGGWPPQPSVEESTWVTSLVALLPPEQVGRERHRQAIDWIYRLTGRETSAVYRIRQVLLGNTSAATRSVHGWPWFPGTAAWVGPTAFGILALQKEYQRDPKPGLAERLELGRRFLLSRMCADGGWNHGASRALGYDAQSYPETTGMALLALRGVQAPELAVALPAGERFLIGCRSVDGQNWLRLGLAAHGRLSSQECRPLPCRTLRDSVVAVLADSAAAGRNPFA